MNIRFFAFFILLFSLSFSLNVSLSADEFSMKNCEPLTIQITVENPWNSSSMHIYVNGLHLGNHSKGNKTYSYPLSIYPSGSEEGIESFQLVVVGRALSGNQIGQELSTIKRILIYHSPGDLESESKIILDNALELKVNVLVNASYTYSYEGYSCNVSERDEHIAFADSFLEKSIDDFSECSFENSKQNSEYAVSHYSLALNIHKNAVESGCIHSIISVMDSENKISEISEEINNAMDCNADVFDAISYLTYASLHFSIAKQSLAQGEYNETILESVETFSYIQNALELIGECKCSDATIYGNCSTQKPYFCADGVLIEKSSLCGCPENLISSDETCIEQIQEQEQTESTQEESEEKEPESSQETVQEVQENNEETPEEYVSHESEPYEQSEQNTSTYQTNESVLMNTTNVPVQEEQEEDYLFGLIPIVLIVFTILVFSGILLIYLLFFRKKENK